MAAKKWSEIAGSPDFAALSDTDKDVVRESFFERVVAPEVAPDQLDATRDQFNSASGYRKRALPAGVKPSEAGAGRGLLGAEAQTPTEGPGAALATIRDQRATVARERATPAPAPLDEGGSVLDRPAFDPTTPTLSDAEYQANYGTNTKPQGLGAATRPGTSTIKPSEPETVAGQVIRQATGKSGLGAAVQGAVQGLGELGAVVPGLVAGAADAVGADQVSEFALGAANRAKGFGEAVQPQGGYYEKLIGNVFSSTVQSLPTMAFGAGGTAELVGGKVVADAAAKKAMTNAMRTLFVQTAGQEYADGRNRGFSPEESALRAGIFGAAEVWGERFGFHEQMAVLRATLGKKKIAPDQLARTLATEVFKEIPGEELTTAVEFLADKMGPAAKSPKATFADYLEQAGDTAIQTVGQTALMGAPAAVRGSYDRANAAMAYDQAARNGLNVVPPYATDTPDVQRKKTLGMFNAIAAQYGIDSAAVKRAAEAAGEMPAEQVGPFLAKLTGALQKRQLVAKPVDEHATDVLTAGLADDPKVLEKQAKEAEKAAAEGKKTDKPAPVSVANTPVPRGTEEDLTGLSEPSRPPAPASAREGTATAAPMDTIAHEAATSHKNDLPMPTEAQKHAENYKVGHDNETIPGMRLSVENGATTTRSGTAPDGTGWSTVMQDHYGRILGTVGMDSTPEKPQHVDFFAKPGTPKDHAGPVFVVDQVDPKTRQPDEHKVMFGYASLAEARKAYLRNYEKGWKGLGAITETTLDDFKTWVKDEANTRRPFAPPSEHRVIARVGSMPTNALPLELRKAEGGKVAAWHDGHEVLDFESGQPVVLPADVSDAAALQAVKDSGAFGRRSKYFDVPASEAAPAPAPVAAQEPDSGVKAPAAAPAEPTASWVIRNKATGDVVMETFDRKKVDALNTEKYEAVPIREHLASLNRPPAPSSVAPKPEVAPAPPPPAPAPPKVKKLSEKEAFANDYAAFAGRDVAQAVQISDTGESATLTIPAQRALRTLDARLKALNDLKGCISRHA